MAQESFEEFETEVAGVRFKRTGLDEISGKGSVAWLPFSYPCSTRQEFENSCEFIWMHCW